MPFPAEFAQAFTPYTAPTITKADWADASVMASKRAVRDGITARIVAELIAEGAEEHVAKTAAGSFMSFRNAPGHGLDGMEDRLLADAAGVALDRWVEGVVARAAAAQDHRVAA